MNINIFNSSLLLSCEALIFFSIHSKNMSTNIQNLIDWWRSTCGFLYGSLIMLGPDDCKMKWTCITNHRSRIFSHTHSFPSSTYIFLGFRCSENLPAKTYVRISWPQPHNSLWGYVRPCQSYFCGTDRREIWFMSRYAAFFT